MTTLEIELREIGISIRPCNHSEGYLAGIKKRIMERIDLDSDRKRYYAQRINKQIRYLQKK